MRSRDEQILWGELQDFPEQILAEDRSEKIFASIREETFKLQRQGKLKKKRSSFGWVANGLVTCAVILAMIWLNQGSFSSETAGSASAVDIKYQEAAQKAVEAVGITKKFEFEEQENDSDTLIVRTKDRMAIVTFQAHTTEVQTISVIVNRTERPERYQAYWSTAKAVLPGAEHFERAHYFQDKTGATLTFDWGARQFVSVDLQTNQVTDFRVAYKPEDVEREFVSIAQNALAVLSDNKSFSFSQAEKASGEKEAVWMLSNEQEHSVVQVGAKTGKVYRISYPSQIEIKSLQEAVSTVKPLLQSIFGLDISAYKAYGGKDWGGYVLKSPGKPDVSVNIGSLDKGDIISLTVKW
ncbi:hypothetical protein [Brevibacillus centrosporus]|uniref:hypothetical protein n=1 Tax=Brevibacillus centrosporus TaxID=54910 RepID=UPI002E23BFA9|nr:hypothetical protein [Brevibacillus centrosporus]